MREYPPQSAVIEVVYNDGEVRSFPISANHKIAHHLMKEAAETMILVVRDDESGRSYCIPLASVRHIQIETVDPHAVVEGKK